jgi:hypothetical protein
VPIDERFASLVKRVGELHITDRAMKQAQSEAEERVRAGDPDAHARRKYIEAVRKYFSGFEKEARTHLRDVDRRLEHINQVQFNLNAERGVAVKRIEATQSVLADLSDVEPPGA